MIKTSLILLFTFLLVISSAYSTINIAITSYNESGNVNNLYQFGVSAFNSQLDPDIVNTLQTTTRVVTDGRKVPLVSDLDGDGVSEIIVLDDRTFSIFQTTTLTFITSFTLDTASGEGFSNILTFDIDDDGLREIIIVAENEKELHILEFNNSVLTNQTRFIGINLSAYNFNNAPSGDRGEVTIKCSSPERCLMIYGSSTTSGFAGAPKTINYNAGFFNSSQEGINTSFQQLIDSTGSASVFCQPNIRHMAVADYDADDGGAIAPDNQKEFITSNMEVGQSISADEQVNVYWIDILENKSVVLENSVTDTRSGAFLSTVNPSDAYTCDNTAIAQNTNAGGADFPVFASFYVTSPLVSDFSSVNGLETIIGIGLDEDEFIMIAFDKDGNNLGRFPNVIFGDSEGIMISNTFQADIFDDSSTDFCTIGFNGDATILGLGISQAITLTCGSLLDDFNGQDTMEFRFNKAGFFNLSLAYDTHDKIAHSINADQTNTGDEILTAYGVFEADTTTCSILNNCDLNLIFQQPKITNNPIVISTDGVDRFGSEDLIILTDLNLFYLDDGASNQPISEWCGEDGSVTGSCSKYVINPCITSIWKQNTTVQIIVTPDDDEDDLTAVRARIYSGDSNVQDSGFINISSGQEFTISVNNVTSTNFIANKTGGGFFIVLDAVDIAENPNDIETVTKTFSVAGSGVETFDCTTSAVVGVDVVDVADVSIASKTIDATDNSITTGIASFTSITGLAGTTIFLVLMLAFSAFIWFEMAQRGMSGNSALGTIAILNILFILIGARVGIFATSLVVILVVLGVAVIGVFLGKFLTGLRTSE